MKVDSVFVESLNSTFSQNDDILTIELPRSYSFGENIQTIVYYEGSPQATGFGSFTFSKYQSKPLVWSLSEPYGARTWWPCKDSPEDKADSAHIKITVPKGMSVASNGLLVNEEHSEITSTFFWKEKYPIATYLISIAAYDYFRYSDTYTTLAGESMPIDFFVFPNHYEDETFRTNYAKTKTMISAFADYFGEYPFVDEKYGHAEYRSVW